MAYIGKQPTIGNFVKLDAITTSATTTFNLTNGGVAYSPQSANHCIVSLNGVIQSPTTSFTISGSTIVFASALTSSDVIDFILVLGDVLNIGTPSDATVGFSKITSNLITGATSETSIAGGDQILIYDDSATALRKMTRTNFVAGIGGTNTPAFFAYQSSDVSISASTITKIQFNTEEYDVGSCYDNSVNYRFTPNVAGKYYVGTMLTLQGGTSELIESRIYIYKNGTAYSYSYQANQNNYSNYQANYQAAVISMNGSSDYIEIFGYIARNGSTSNVLAHTRGTYFQAYKIIE